MWATCFAVGRRSQANNHNNMIIDIVPEMKHLLLLLLLPLAGVRQVQQVSALLSHPDGPPAAARRAETQPRRQAGEPRARTQHPDGAARLAAPPGGRRVRRGWAGAGGGGVTARCSMQAATRAGAPPIAAPSSDGQRKYTV